MPEITKVNVGGTTYDIVDNTKVKKTGDTMSGTLTIDKSGSIQFNYNDAYARLNLIGYNGTTPTSYTPRLQVLGGGGATYGVQIEGLAAPSIDSAAANKQYVDQKVASAIGDITGVEFNTDYTSYADLPTTGEAGVIYLIPNSGSAPNIYDEYIYAGNKYEKIGTTDIDLTDYATKSFVTTTLVNDGLKIIDLGEKTIPASGYTIMSGISADTITEIANNYQNKNLAVRVHDSTNNKHVICFNVGTITFSGMNFYGFQGSLVQMEGGNPRVYEIYIGIGYGSESDNVNLIGAVRQVDTVTLEDSGMFNGYTSLTSSPNMLSIGELTHYNGSKEYVEIPTDLSNYVNDVGYITSITSTDVTTALGYTPSAEGHTHDYSKVTFTQTNTSGDEIGKIIIDGVTTTLYADSNTDTKVTQTLTTPTASATYPILFTNTASKSSTSTDTARFDTGFHYNPYFGSVFTKGPASTISSSASGYRLGLESGTQTGAFVNGVAGTTSTVGQARLFLGNDIASGTANNAEGSIMLYGQGAYYTQIRSAAADGNKAVTFPNLGGTVALLENPQTFTGAKTFSATTTLNNRIVGKIGAPSAGNYTTTVPTAAGVNGQIMFVTIS